MHISAHFMHGSYFLACNKHETLLTCMNHDWFMHRNKTGVKRACFKEIGIIYVYNMRVTGIHA